MSALSSREYFTDMKTSPVVWMHMCNITGLIFIPNIVLTLQIDIWMNQHCLGKERLRIIMRLASDSRITLGSMLTLLRDKISHCRGYTSHLSSYALFDFKLHDTL
jgi:hypothetical protein